MRKTSMLSGLLRMRYLVVAMLLLSGSAIPVYAQDDDDTAFVTPAWAEAAMEEADADSCLAALEKLAPAHRNAFELPYLQSQLWRIKGDEAATQAGTIVALQQERRYLLRAVSLAGGAKNAAVLAEIKADLRDVEKSLRDEGVAVAAAQPAPVKAPPQRKAPPVRKQPVAKRPAPVRRVTAPPVATRPTQTVPIKKLPPMARRPGYVVGRAIFPDGRPIPKFKVIVMGYDGQINIFPGATPQLGFGEGKNGRYAIRTMDTLNQKKPVAGLVVGLHLSTKIRYLGKDYTLYLHPMDGIQDGGSKGQFKANSGPGIVRDYVLKISGVKPRYRIYNQDENNGPNEATTFYGGQLTLDITNVEGTGEPLSSTAPAGSKIVVTLVPQGPLLDGSRGQTVVRRATLKPGGANFYFYLRNIPIGAYSVSAQLVTPAGETWNLRGSTSRENYTSTTKVVFPPSFSDFIGGADTVNLYVVR